MSTPVPDETILGILAAAPQHGYQIMQHFTEPEALGRIWTMSTSQIYAVLKRLENQGAIIGSNTPSQEGPPKKQYAITLSGEAQLKLWLYTTNPSTSIRHIRIEFLSKLYLARILGLPTFDIIKPQIQACLQRQDKLVKRQTVTTSEMEKLALDFILSQLGAAVDWLKNLDLNNA